MAFRINTIEVTPLGEQYTQVAVVEGIFLGGRPITTFNELTDTPSSKTPNLFVASDSSGSSLEFVDPELQEGGGISLDVNQIRNNPTISAKLGDGLEIDPDNAITVDDTVLRDYDKINTADGIQGGGDLGSNLTLTVDSSVARSTTEVIAGDGLQDGGNLGSDITLNVDSTVVRTTREINAGNGLVQDNNLLSGNINIDVQTPLNSGLSATVNDLKVDINGTQESTVVTGTDTFLLEDVTGEKYRITRDNLFAGIGGGIELRGHINPTSAWTPNFISSARVSIPEWSSDIGNVIRFTTVFRGDSGSSTNEFILDYNGANRTYIRKSPSGNWSFTSSNIDLFIDDGTGETQITDDTVTITPDVFYYVRVAFKVNTTGITHIGGFYNGLGATDYNGEIYDVSFTQSGGDNRLYTSQLSQYNEPTSVTEYLDIGTGAQHGTLANSEWIIRSFEEATGDQINSVIFLGTAPNFAGVSPAGYTYVILLNESDKSTGARIRLGGGVNMPDEATVFDQDQISWVGDEINGGWAHLETGNSVISVFGRTGNIVSENGDYTASQLVNVPNGNLIANNVQGALDELQVDIDNLDVNKVSKTGDNMSGALSNTSNLDRAYRQASSSNGGFQWGVDAITGDFLIAQSTGTTAQIYEKRAFSIDRDGATNLYYDDTVKLTTLNDGVSVNGFVKSSSAPIVSEDLTRKDYVDGVTGNNTTYDGGRI